MKTLFGCRASARGHPPSQDSVVTEAFVAFVTEALVAFVTEAFVTAGARGAARGCSTQAAKASGVSGFANR